MEYRKIIIIIGFLALLAVTVLLGDALKKTEKISEDIEWCFAEYVKVDRAIILCINGGQGTLQKCLEPWNHKAYLLAELNCRCFIFPDAEGCS